MINGNETIHRVVDDLPRAGIAVVFFVKGLIWIGDKSTLADFKKLFLMQVTGHLLLLNKLRWQQIPALGKISSDQ